MAFPTFIKKFFLKMVIKVRSTEEGGDKGGSCFYVYLFSDTHVYTVDPLFLMPVHPPFTTLYRVVLFDKTEPSRGFLLVPLS